MRIASALKLLAAGEFVCEQRFPDEYESLESPEGHAQASAWLQQIGYRLARLHDEGAFFMAHEQATMEVRTQIREEMRTVRSRLQPVVSILETIRQSQGRDPRVHAGDMLYVSEIAEEARKSTMLETRIMELREVTSTRHDDTLVTRIKRMLDKLLADGYAELKNESRGGYQITGKIDYLYQLIAYIVAHAPHMGDEKLVDQIEQPDTQMRLEQGAQPPSQGGGEAS